MFTSYAQNFEDVILNRIFKDKESGFYIDIGAHHPVYDSVTKAFYDRGWRGINVEPVRDFFELLQRDRPEDVNLNLAVGEQKTTLEFFELQGSGFSTLDSNIAIKLAAERQLALSCYEVSVTTLSEICQKYGSIAIDFLKIDVEGWEEQVIAGNDWDTFRPTVIIIEATIPNSPVRRETNIASFLQEKGYDLVYFDGLNDYYLAKEFSQFRFHFQTPPNVFDNFSIFRLKDLTDQTILLNKSIQERDREITILNQCLEDERFESQRLSRELKKLKLFKDEQIKYYQIKESELQILISQLNHKILDLEALKTDLYQAQEKILAMESSKFWKLRYFWFRLRKRLGISGD